MAEQAITPLVTRLTTFLEEGASSIFGVDDEVQKLRSELKSMQSFLKDAEGKSKSKERNKNWINQLIEVCHESEDAIDTFLAKVERYRIRVDPKGKAKKFIHMPIEMIDRLQISSRIKKINEKINGLKKAKLDYDIHWIPGEGTSQEDKRLHEKRRIDSCAGQPNVTVGLESLTDELVKQLSNAEPRLRIISVVGQGGLGKTTLAKKVYTRAKNNFTSSAWIYVSRDYKVEEVLHELCKAASHLSKQDMKDLNASDLREKIARYWGEEKYLVVLDDVWALDAWNFIKDAFPDGTTGSRVLITTREMEVANYACNGTPPYRPPLLNQRDSYELFCRNAFPSLLCPSELRSSAYEIVEKCGGLPLELVAAGGLLSTKKPTVQEWEETVTSLAWEMTRGTKEVSSILALSFDDLDHGLKPCMLYSCFFPGDSEIRVKRLLRLWIAEGFVERRDGKTLEAVAMDYLHELIDRSLIQASKRNSIGEIKACRVQDLLREMLIARAEQLNFFKIHSADSHDLSKCRRLAIHRHLEQKPCRLHLARTFMSFGENHPKFWCDQIKSFELLKVLDLEGLSSVETLPEEIGGLVLLSYLGLRYTSVTTLPRSTKNLFHLQTLDMKSYAKTRFSRSIVTLKMKAKHVRYLIHLRHLYFGNRHDNIAMEVPDDFGVKGSEELQTLSYVKAGGWVDKGLRNMTNLRKLGIQVTEGYQGKTFGSIATLGHLHRLYLQGSLEDLTTDAFRNLTKLTLDSSCLHNDPFSVLQTLQKLKILTLRRNAFLGNRMTCSGGGFPQLEALNLDKLEFLQDISVEVRAFPRLIYMRIASCVSMTEVPQGLPHVESLQELKLVDMGQLIDRAQHSVGEEWGKIKHIPSIIITTSALERFDGPN